MKVVIRSSSLLFFFVTLLLGLPIRRRVLGDAGRGLGEEKILAGRGGGRFGWRALTPQQDKSAAEPVAE